MDIKIWLQEKIAEESGLQLQQVPFNKEFEEFKLDSLSLISLAFDLEKQIGVDEIDPTVFTEYNSINKLAEWIERKQ